MLRPLIFCDLAGTLEVRDPATGLSGPWPGVRAVLEDLARDHELHLATGDSQAGAVVSLRELGLREVFAALHTGLVGGGKPFGTLAAAAARPPSACLAVGDDPAADTAGDSDAIVSVIVSRPGACVAAPRLAELVRALGHAGAGSFLAGFTVALARVAAADSPGGSPQRATRWLALPGSELAGGCRLGWWQKAGSGPRPVVVLEAPLQPPHAKNR
jgi:hypothetical protein